MEIVCMLADLLKTTSLMLKAYAPDVLRPNSGYQESNCFVFETGFALKEFQRKTEFGMLKSSKHQTQYDGVGGFWFELVGFGWIWLARLPKGHYDIT